MVSIPRGHYYVYTLARPSGRVFYVGKGVGKRIHKHEEEARTTCGCHKCRVIRKIWRQGGSVTKNIVYVAVSEIDALLKESEWINHYGLNNLTNVLPGLGGFVIPANRISRYNEAAYIASLRRNGVSRLKRAELMEDWYDRKIDALRKRRKYAVLIQDVELQRQIDDAITAYKIALGEIVQLSFSDIL